MKSEDSKSANISVKGGSGVNTYVTYPKYRTTYDDIEKALKQYFNARGASLDDIPEDKITITIKHSG
jgi:hypothetical protein